MPKEKFAANGGYNLSGERYRDGAVATAAWPLVPLGEVTRRVSGGTPSKENSAFWSGSVPWVSPKDMKVDVLRDTEDHVSEEAIANSATSRVPAGTLLCVVRSGILKHTLPLALTGREMCFNQDIVALSPSDGRLDIRYLFSILKARSKRILEQGIKPGVTVQSFHAGFFSEYQIPLPPLEVQKEIVAEIEGYQKVIDGAHIIVGNYRPHIPIHPDWPMVSIKDVSIRITKGSSPNWQGVNYCGMEGGILFVTSENVGLGQLLLEEPKYVEQRFNEIEPKSVLQSGDVLTNIVGASIGRTAIFDLDLTANINQAVCMIRPNTDLIDATFLMTMMNSTSFIRNLVGNSVENARANVSMGVLGSLLIPLPPLTTQQAIVAEIEAEQALVAANHELIVRFEKKIQSTLARVWGEEHGIQQMEDQQTLPELAR